MNELRLEVGQDVYIFLDRHAVLGLERVERAKSFLNHFASKGGESDRAGARRIDKELTLVKFLTPYVIVDGRVKVNCVVHRYLLVNGKRTTVASGRRSLEELVIEKDVGRTLDGIEGVA